MNSLWKNRLKKHQKDQLKYLRLIFNDQFVIAMIFMVGSLGFWYSNFLKSITEPQWWGKVIISSIGIIMISTGHLATLLQKADATFLLPKENMMMNYLKQSRTYSLIFPVLMLIVIMVIVYPLANIAASIKSFSYIIFVISLIIFKISIMNFEIKDLYSNNYNIFILLFLILLISIFSFYTNIFIMPIISLVFLALSRIKSSGNQELFQWNKAIKKEEARSFNIKKFYNLFTDVPGISSRVERRKYFDFIFKLFKNNHNNTYLYIYSRSFFRNNEYIGLYLRLLIIQLAILFFVNNIWLSAIILVIFIYLVGFQLKPLYKQYSNNFLQKIYPIENYNQSNGFLKLVFCILMIQLIFSFIPIIYVFKISLNSVIILGIGFIEVLIYTFIVLKNNLSKIDD